MKGASASQFGRFARVTHTCSRTDRFHRNASLGGDEFIIDEQPSGNYHHISTPSSTLNPINALYDGSYVHAFVPRPQ